MLELRSIVIIYILFVLLATTYIHYLYINWPTVRARIVSDWTSPLLEEGFAMQRIAYPEFVNTNEGFIGSSSENLAQVLATAPEPDAVSGKYVPLTQGEDVKRSAGPYTLIEDTPCLKSVERVSAADKGPWSDGAAGNEPNAEDCYRHNYQACLNSTGGSYAQVTNNYMRTNPDSCSSPLHEFLGNFYKST
jgi:hypothetical protein